MIVAATPIVPPDGDRCWAFHVVNDTTEPIRSIVVERVSYEWGDQGNSEKLGHTFGPIPPGGTVEVHRETDTEVRTALTLRVHDADGERVIFAEVGRLYATPRGMVDIPVLGRPGKLATLEVVGASPG